jgi:hypothetical protein
MMRPGWTAKPRQARKYQEPHAPSDGITGDTICHDFPRGPANALAFTRERPSAADRRVQRLVRRHFSGAAPPHSDVGLGDASVLPASTCCRGLSQAPPTFRVNRPSPWLHTIGSTHRIDQIDSDRPTAVRELRRHSKVSRRGGRRHRCSSFEDRRRRGYAHRTT